MDCEDWDDDGDMDEDMALLVRHEEVRDAQAGDVQRMDGLGHSPVVPHPRQLRPPPHPIGWCPPSHQNRAQPAPDPRNVATGESAYRSACFLAGAFRYVIQSTT
ncbi:hypothetical protein BKH35_09730 [Actinomyces naeslundii]|nr:hypothetical protein BKH35_09730 [Actinomyces naeslundii]